MDSKLEKKEDYEKVKIVLLIDEKLSEAEVKILNELFTISFFNKKLDTNKRIEDLAETEILVIKLDNPIKGESQAMTFIQNNINKINDDYYFVYKKSRDIIDKKNLDKLKCDFVINRIPIMDILNKHDFLQKFMSNKMPNVRSNFSIVCGLLLRFFKVWAG